MHGLLSVELPNSPAPTHPDFGQIVDQMFRKVFDQIFGQGFDQGLGEGKQ